jgi:hypothetical protein
VAGGTSDLTGQSIQSAAPIDGGSRLAVTPVGGTTLDDVMSNLQQGASFQVEPECAAPTGIFAFSYNGGGGDNGTGSPSPGAFAEGVPRHELWLSPGRAVFADGVSIPVRYLENGNSVAPVGVDVSVCCHVQRDRHDVVLADGLAAESCLDTGDRAHLAGGSVLAPKPGFATRVREAHGCVPAVVTGPVLDGVRQRLAAWDAADAAATRGAAAG